MGSFRGAEGNLMALAGTFIAVAILLGVGTIILGNSIQDCTGLPGFDAGQVTGVTVTDGGLNYTTAPTVSFSGGGGSGAAATATTNGNQTTAVTVTDPGTGYTTAPTVSFSHVNGTGAAATATITTVQTGWSATCEDANEQAQSAYVLLLIVLIVIAAVVILTVVRQL